MSYHKLTWGFIIIYLGILCGCSATLLSYNPTVNMDILDAMQSIKEKILTQPDGRSPSQAYITESFIKLSGNFEGEKSLTDKSYTLIRFNTITNLTLHNKNEWFLVSLVKKGDGFNRLLFRYFTKNEDTAKKFMNNIYSMMEHKPNPYKPISIENQVEIKKSYPFTKEDVNHGQSPEVNITTPPVKDKNPNDINDISDKLKELKNLKDLGILTNSEYESKRKILADRL
ncbi:MAG: SHOCT domain-containing protein [Methylococcales bacterium]|nr:SHOCT domain-containing protein [Methylococcales bacterium]